MFHFIFFSLLLKQLSFHSGINNSPKQIQEHNVFSDLSRGLLLLLNTEYIIKRTLHRYTAYCNYHTCAILLLVSLNIATNTVSNSK